MKKYIVLGEEKVESTGEKFEGRVYREIKEYETLKQAVAYILKNNNVGSNIVKIINWDTIEKHE